ncbi:MAG: universal stress protein [Ktedonobacteraceae bacterium]
MFQRILVPLDGSQRAERAVPTAARIAHATNGTVVLLQVVSQPVEYLSSFALAPMVTDESIEQELAEAKSYIAALAESAILRGLDVRTEVQFGLAGEQILGVIESLAVDLVVLCSHGWTGFKRWALGSVAHRVIHNSHVPMLILREGGPSLPVMHADAARPLCSMVALDGSPLAETALLPTAHLIAALAQPSQGVVHLMYVIKPLTSAADEGVFPHHEAEVAQRAQEYLKGVRERLLAQTSDLNLLVTWSVTRAQDVAETLVVTAEEKLGGPQENNCDVLAMATHGRGGVARWVMGSVTERVLQATTLPMLVVRPLQADSHS